MKKLILTPLVLALGTVGVSAMAAQVKCSAQGGAVQTEVYDQASEGTTVAPGELVFSRTIKVNNVVVSEEARHLPNAGETTHASDDAAEIVTTNLSQTQPVPLRVEEGRNYASLQVTNTYAAATGVTLPAELRGQVVLSCEASVPAQN